VTALGSGCSAIDRCAIPAERIVQYTEFYFPVHSQDVKGDLLFRLQGIHEYGLDYSTVTVVVPAPEFGAGTFRLVPYTYCLNESHACNREARRRWGKVYMKGEERRAVYVDALVRPYDIGDVAGCPGGGIIVMKYGPSGWATVLDGELVSVEPMGVPLAE